MGKPETITSITPFWYKRISEITWLLTIILVGLWAAGLFGLQGDIAAMHLDVPLPSVMGAIAASIIMIVAYARPHRSSSSQLIKLGYILMVLTSLYTVFATGDVNSPFIALWLLVSIFPAIFGLSVFIPVVLATNIYLAYLYFFNIVSMSELPIFIIAFELPLAVSFLIWRKGVKRASLASQTEKDPTFKALAKELSAVSNQSDIVINAIADGVIAVDGQGIVQLINPAAQRIIGWGKQDALKLDYRSVLQLFNAKNAEVKEDADPIQKCLHTNETVETDDLQLATTSGKKLMASLLVSPIGQIGSGAIVVFRDITNQRKDERQQAEFISTASHEMRTPVAAIEGYIGLALNPATATIDDKAKMYLGKAHESAQHLGRLFQDLLDISKAEDGRLDNDPRVIDLVAYMRDITASFNHMASTKGLILLYKPDTSSSTDQRVTPAFFVHADPDHIREVTANLIENAIKYTKSGDVTVNVIGDDERAEVAITDTGIGIPQEDIPHLFQKFYRVDNTDTREIGGTGLGLYLCRRLVETMGGRLWVTSDYGRGSTFHVELPRMSNIEAMRAIESATPEETEMKFHAKASFLAGEEEAAAIKQATTTPSKPAVATPAPAPVAPAVSTTPAAAPQTPITIQVMPSEPTAPAPATTPAPPAPAAAPVAQPAPVAPAPTPAPQPTSTPTSVPIISIFEDGTVASTAPKPTQPTAPAPRTTPSATPRANPHASSEPKSSGVAL